MKLMKARIRGFQSFSDTGDIEFAAGINLIVGQNNSGKSALLRALLLTIPDDRHRTPDKWQNFELPIPDVALTVEVTGDEIREWILRSGEQQWIPVEAAQPPVSIQESARAFVTDFFNRPGVRIAVSHSAANNTFSAPHPSHQLFPPQNRAFPSMGVTPNNGVLRLDGVANNDGDSIPGLLQSAWQRNMFYFSAERMTFGEAAAGYHARLTPNASNLPNILLSLQGEQGDVFELLVNHLREIFPTVGNLSVRPKRVDHNIEVLVWPTPAQERPELSFPLNSSGTGVAQVVALLTAIMTINRAIIIIDEINSFLHSAAVKALLRILQTHYAHHQYIISTHAPEVIGFSNATTIHLVKRLGYDSTVERLEPSSVGQFREVASHLGVSMADVFAAERVIWVEGQTEELCFPYAYQQLVGPLPLGTIFTTVVATGDFNANRRDRDLVYEVYERLSAAAATLPVSVAFSFDSERLRDEDKDEMQRESRGKLHFLPRRNFECFLIEPEAIAAFITERDQEITEHPNSAAVADALRQAAGTADFRVTEWRDDLDDPAWLARVDAAKLIDDVCGTLSNQRVRFGKTSDSLFLLRHILERTPGQLKPLRDYVQQLVEAVSAN